MKIVSRYGENKILWEGEATSIKEAVEKAVKENTGLSGAYLSGADLSRANLCGADLSGADLRGAYLSRAGLSGADLRGANLRGADLSGANLSRADLSGAYLSGADLSRANLRGADLSVADLRGAYLSRAGLSGAYLSGADLSRANLCGADLRDIKKDYFERMLLQKDEIQGLYKAILEGKIDGSSYEGECACFVGTIAKVCNTPYERLPKLKPDSKSLTEKWFLGIRKGDTPENSQISKITAEWTKEFLEANEIPVPVMKIVWE